MNTGNRGMCRFCLKTLYNHEFNITEEITKQMLDVLYLKLNLNIGNDTMMCSQCLTNLQTAIEFKSICINAENKSILSEEKVKSEQDDIKENTNVEIVHFSQDKKICRFCMRVTNTDYFKYLQKESIFIVDIVQKYIPELHLKLTEELVTCRTCLDSLQSFLNLITNCSNVEEAVTKNMVEANIENLLKLEYEVCSSNDNIPKKESFEDIVGDIKDEIKDENPMEVDNTIFEISESSQNIIHPARLENKELCKGSLEEQILTNSKAKAITYNGKNPYKAFASKIALRYHMLVHQDVSERTLYNCQDDSYVTKYKHNLKSNMLTQHNPSEVEVYNCKRCRFKTKYKGSLKRHMLMHQVVLKRNVYKCENCSFQTKTKSNLKNHELIHADNSKVTVYKCEMCPYQTMNKRYLTGHMLKHRMYKCARCSFKSKYDHVLNTHMQSHSDIKTYKCEKCCFQTIRFHNFYLHNLKEHR